MAERPKAIVVDIEGTTTPISFVADVLFPYARAHLAEFVAAHGDDPAVRQALAEVRSLEGVPGLSDPDVVERLESWIDEDRKATPLKTLQGLIWRRGYETGEFTAPLYPDVMPALRSWRHQGARLCVYSSGSVEAQLLLFRYSSEGDVTGLFEDLFDTRVGAKVEAQSYGQIAYTLGLRPPAILFLTDNPAEVAAAREAGWQVIRIDRALPEDGAVREDAGGFVAPSFNAVEAWLRL